MLALGEYIELEPPEEIWVGALAGSLEICEESPLETAECAASDAKSPSAAMQTDSKAKAMKTTIKRFISSIPPLRAWKPDYKNIALFITG